MNLYILRHGIAADRDYHKYPDDGLRPLTNKGIARMRREAQGMNAIGVSPDVIIASPLVRAAQTAEIVCNGMNAPPRMATSPALAPGAHPSVLMQELAANYPADGSVMVVGHEPHLSSLVSYILTSEIAWLIKLKKGALCKVQAPSYGRGRLLWALTPKQVRALAQPI